jgi:hypothetical protein
VNKFSAMSKRVEFMWEYSFPQIEGSGDREKTKKEVDEGRRSAEDSESPQKGRTIPTPHSSLYG